MPCFLSGGMGVIQHCPTRVRTKWSSADKVVDVVLVPERHSTEPAGHKCQLFQGWFWSPCRACLGTGVLKELVCGVTEQSGRRENVGRYLDR